MSTKYSYGNYSVCAVCDGAGDCGYCSLDTDPDSYPDHAELAAMTGGIAVDLVDPRTDGDTTRWMYRAAEPGIWNAFYKPGDHIGAHSGTAATYLEYDEDTRTFYGDGVEYRERLECESPVSVQTLWELSGEGIQVLSPSSYFSWYVYPSRSEGFFNLFVCQGDYAYHVDGTAGSRLKYNDEKCTFERDGRVYKVLDEVELRRQFGV